MEQSPSWEANQTWTSQEIPRILWNSKGNYRIQSARHLSLSWSSSFQSTPPISQFLKIHLNIILPSKAGSSKWPLSLRFPHQNPVCTSPLPHMRYMPHPPHSSQLNHPNKNGWGAQIIKLPIIYFSPLPFYLDPLRPKRSPQNPIFKHLQPPFFPQCERPSFTPIQNNRKNYSSVYFNL